MIDLNLPEDLVETGQEVRAVILELAESWGSDIRLLKGSQSDPINIYDCYPFLFESLFPRIDRSDLLQFAVACKLIASAVTLTDRVVDSDPSRHGDLETAARASIGWFRSLAMRSEANRVLMRLFPPDALFWEVNRACDQELVAACLDEYKFAVGGLRWDRFNRAVARRIMIGKSAPARIVSAGMADLSRDSTYMIRMDEAIDCFNYAFQIIDDLVDFRKDVQRGIPTLPLFLVSPDGLPKSRSAVESDQWLDDMVRRLYVSGNALTLIEEAIRSLERAKATLPGAPAWQNFIAVMEGQYRSLRTDVSRMLDQRVFCLRNRQASLPELPMVEGDLASEVFQDALAYITRQWKQGYPEAVHLHCFHRRGLLEAASPNQSGDVFQRAVLADVLLDANRWTANRLHPMVENEVEYLLERRNVSGVGGWSYFPDLRELPPDADSLGQILQVLTRAGRAALAWELSEPALRTIFEDNPYTDGSFDTWIIPTTDRTRSQERQARMVHDEGWTGGDPEVVANLLYGLLLVNSRRHGTEVLRGVRYLESVQDAGGFWQASWYEGPFYGTYVAVRLLRTVAPLSPAIDGAIAFLRETQSDDGGWCYRDAPDPLSTSLAILTIVGDGEHGNTDECLTRALGYLKSSRGEGGVWSPVPFGRMERSYRGESQAPLFSSSTVTTGYVLKAAAHCMQQPLFRNAHAANASLQALPANMFRGVDA